MTTTPTKALPVVAHTLKTLAARDWPQQEDIISPWFKQGESCLLWAATGIGKTMLSLTLALLVAGGGKVAGWSNEKPRKVAYIDGEMRTADLVKRLIDLTESIEGIDREKAWSNLTIHSQQDQKLGVDFYNICNPETQNGLCDALKRGKFELVILDNLTTLANVKDENDAAAMRPVLDFMRKIKQSGLSAILVHHSGKSGKSFRGSSAMETTFEVTIGLEKPENTPFSQTQFDLSFTKFRGVRTDAVKPRRFRFDEGRWHVEENDTDDIGRLLQAIETCLYATQGAAGEALGFDKTKTSKLLGKAKAAGRTDAMKLAAYFEAASGFDSSDLSV